MHRTASRPASRGTLAPTVVGFLILAAGIGGFLSQVAPASPANAANGRRDEPGWPTTEADGVVTRADGALPAGVTVDEEQYPGISNLGAGLRRALRDAARDAAGDGIAITVNSGWRSPEYQEDLLLEAVATHGSRTEAARWVATAETSPHVSGDAVDIGPAEAAAWLAEHGERFGLCRIYRNEPWHFELRLDAVEGGCPPMYADPTRDPRMRR